MAAVLENRRVAVTAELAALKAELQVKEHVSSMLVGEVIYRRKKAQADRASIIEGFAGLNPPVERNLVEILDLLDWLGEWIIQQSTVLSGNMGGSAGTSRKGTINPYVEKNSIRMWLTLFENYVVLNRIPEEEVVRLLLNSIGEVNAGNLIQRCRPEEASAKSFEDIKLLCLQMFEENVNEYTAIVQIFNRIQQKGESAQEYALDLSEKADHFEFASVQERDNILKYRFISGLVEEKVKWELFKRDLKEWSFPTACKAAETFEVTKNSMENQSVHNVKNDKKWEQKPKKEHEFRCFKCNKKGHYKRNCPEKLVKKVHDVESNEEAFGSLNINNIFINSLKHKIYKTFSILGIDIRLEIDCGSPITLMGWKTYQRYFGQHPLKVFTGELKGAGNASIPVKGFFEPEVRFGGKCGKIKVIVSSLENYLAGTDTLDVFFPGWREVFEHGVNSVARGWTEDTMGLWVRNKYPGVFDGNTKEPIRGFEVQLHLKKGVKPIFKPPYKVPYNLQERVATMLGEAEKSGILVRVEKNAGWASPMVVVAKANGQLRLCMDPSRTINDHLEYDHYPLPIIDDVLVEVGGHEYYCVIDLTGAYQQLLVEEPSRELLVLNTQVGLFQYTRLPFGIKPAASVFQRFMDGLLRLLKKGKAVCFIDDVLIWGEDPEELLMRLCEFLELAQEYNVKANWEKCRFMVREVKYLGHILSKKGVSASPDKVRAIEEAPVPKDVSELRSFIGLVNYCSKFIPNLNVKMAPLFEMLKKGVKFEWDDKKQEAFECMKKALSSERVLEHYNPKFPIVIIADASDKGVGGVLGHLVNGIEKPVLFVSRTISQAERNYPILHREALALTFVMEKCYKYLFGIPFVAFTDHQPLVGIFGAGKMLSPIIANRLQRFAIRLSIFDFQLKYRPGTRNQLADVLSRLPVKGAQEDLEQEENGISQLNTILFNNEEMSLNFEVIKKFSKLDPELIKIREYITSGWPKEVPAEFKDFVNKKEDLSYEGDILLYQGRIVVPKVLVRKALEMLHKNHIGSMRMKLLARPYLFWVGMDKDLEGFTKSCEICQSCNTDHRAKTFAAWPSAKRPMERVHIDFFYKAGKEFLILVDAYSSWVDIQRMGKKDAGATIGALKKIFAVLGEPITMVSDNGPPFSSFEFEKFCEAREIRLLHSPPFHPPSNGLAERQVGEAKRFLSKALEEQGKDFDMDVSIVDFLKSSRFTPSCSGKIPANEIFKFEPITNLKKLELALQGETGAVNWMGNRRVEFEPGEEAWYAVVNSKVVKRVPCIIREKLGKVMYWIEVGRERKTAHMNQLLKRGKAETVLPNEPLGSEVDMNMSGEQTSILNHDTSTPLVNTRERPIRDRRPVVRYQSEDFRIKKKLF